MTKHSKNNTASSIFSYAEHKKLEYGTKRQRLGNESMRRFDACALCLQRARDPVACHEGHLFCKECVYTDLLTQKRDIKRQKERLAALQKEAEAEKARAKAAARERVLEEFEKGHTGLGAATKGITTSGAEGEDEGKGEGDARGTKRKFTFDLSAAEARAQEAEEAALRQIEREHAEALRAKLPDFWLPSLTPTYATKGEPRSLADVRVVTTCRGGVEGHPFAMKTLVPVKFCVRDDAEAKRVEDPEAICPSCKKALSNSMRMFLMKPCSHVTCKTCTDTLVRPSKQCLVCDTALGEKDVVELKREGTGFAGGGLAETSKTGVAFQG